MIYFYPLEVLERAGGFYLDPLNWRRVRLLTQPFDRVTLVCTCVRDVPADWDDDEWIRLPGGVTILNGCPAFYRRGSKFVWWQKALFFLMVPVVLYRSRRSADGAEAVGFLWMVHPVALAGLAMVFSRRLPSFTVVIGSPVKTFLSKSRRRGVAARLIFRVLAAVFSAVQRALIRRSRLVLTTGPHLVRELGAGEPFSTATFSAKDVVPEPPALDDANVYIWSYVGGISYDKGVDTLLEAFAMVQRTSGRGDRALLIGQRDWRFPLEETMSSLQLADTVPRDRPGRVVGGPPGDPPIPGLRFPLPS